jgi:hypothetical protein
MHGLVIVPTTPLEENSSVAGRHGSHKLRDGTIHG